MSIDCYTGTPGSGKSTHLARECFDYLRFGKTVISNFPLNVNLINRYNKGFFSFFRKKINPGKFISRDMFTLDVPFLVKYALDNHKKGVENQTLLCIDECHIFFNCREFSKQDRIDWINFFLEHRKLGYRIILVTPNIRIVDKQIRGVFENEVKHRLVNNMGLAWLLPVKTFVAVTYWVGVRTKLNTEFFTGNKFLFNFFDSYNLLGSLSSIGSNAVPGR